MTESFTDEVSSRLGHYVYRLIDPRNGKTFYIGMGQGNRVCPCPGRNQEQ